MRWIAAFAPLNSHEIAIIGVSRAGSEILIFDPNTGTFQTVIKEENIKFSSKDNDSANLCENSVVFTTGSQILLFAKDKRRVERLCTVSLD